MSAILMLKPKLKHIQGFGREKELNRSRFIGSNLVILCYKQFEKFALCKSVTQSEATCIVYSKQIEGRHVNRQNSVENLQT